MPVDLLMMSSAFLVLTMAMGQLLIKNQRPVNRWLICLLFTCFTWIAHAVLYRAGLIQQYPHLNKLYVPFLCITGPLWYIYIYTLHETDFKRSFHYHLIIPIAVTFCLSFPFYLESESFKREFIETNIDNVSSLMMFMATRYAEITIIVYTFMSMRYLQHVNRNAADNYSLNTTRVLWIFSLLATLAAITRLIGAITGISAISVVVPTMIVAGILVFLYLLSYRKPVVLGLDRSDSSIKNVTDNDVLMLEGFRQQIMSEKWYLDPDLKLQKLARKLSISPNKLSELINQIEGINFNQFVNKIRIQHAKSLMTDDPKLSNDDIAYNSGFNSRTLFYGKFKQFTGTTPAEFKKNLTHKAVDKILSND